MPWEIREAIEPSGASMTIVSPTVHSPSVIRQLWPHEAGLLDDHFRRLHPEDRRRRFGFSLSDDRVREHAAKALSTRGVVVKGLFIDGALAGAAELWIDAASGDAEAAFSVERAHQRKGHGRRLFNRIIRTARNRGVGSMTIICMPDNPAMIALARSQGAAIRLDVDGMTGRIDGGLYSPFAIGSEFMTESFAYWLTMQLWSLPRGEARAA